MKNNNTVEEIDFTNENNPKWGNYPPNDLDVAKWHYFEGIKGGFNPKPLQLCWVRLFETHGSTILEESYHLGLCVEMFREEYDRELSSSKLIKNYERKFNRFIDHDGYIIGDGSGTEEYQWKPCVSEFQNWGDAVKWKAIRNYNKNRILWEKNQRGAYHFVKERCISKIKLKRSVLNAND